MHHLKFKKIRIEFGVCIKEISTLLNMTDANYAKIERGEIEISIKNLIKLSDYYKVPVDELIMKNNNEKVDLQKINEYLLSRITLLEKELIENKLLLKAVKK